MISPGISDGEILPVPDLVAVAAPGLMSAQLTVPGSETLQWQPPPAAGPSRRGRKIAGTAASLVLVGAIFGFAFKRQLLRHESPCPRWP